MVSPARLPVMFDLAPLGDSLLRGIVLALLALIWTLLLTRVVGLRTFSKMTAFDFVVTLAVASLLATAAAASSWAGFVQPMTAIGTLIGAQITLALARRRSDRVRRMLENDPMLLMRDGRFIDAALRRTRVTRHDIISKLRQANVASLDQVRAVVLEATGDIAILHGETPSAALMDTVDTVAERAR